MKFTEYAILHAANKGKDTTALKQELKTIAPESYAADFGADKAMGKDRDNYDSSVRNAYKTRALTTQLNDLSNQSANLNRFTQGLSRGALGSSGAELVGQQRKSNETQLAEVNAQIAQTKADLEKQKRLEFDKAQANEKAKLESSISLLGVRKYTPEEYSSLASKTPDYDVSLALDENRRNKEAETALANGGVLTNSYLAYLSPTEKTTLANFVNLGQEDKAKKYLESMKYTLTAREREEVGKATAEGARQNPIAGGLLNIVSSFGAPLSYLATVGGAAREAITGEYRPVDTNANAFLASRLQEDTQTGINQAITDKLGEGTGANVANFLANTALSIGQFATKIPLGATGALAYMATGAAGQSSYNALERGGSASQAALIGTASGVIEALTEKIPLDNLFKIAKGGGTSALKSIAKQAGIEAAEEAISEVANNIVDIAAMGDNSEFKQYIEFLKTSKGMSQSQAEAEAVKQFFVVNTVKAGIGGGISGGLMAGGANIVNSVSTKANVDTRNDTDSVIEPQVNAEMQEPQSATNLPQAPAMQENATQSVTEPMVETNNVNATLENRRDAKNGWGKKYGTAMEAVNDAIKSVNPKFYEAFEAERFQGNTNAPITNAVIAVQEDVRQDTITPLQAARYVSRVYNESGADGLTALYSPRNGNLYNEVLEEIKSETSTNSVANATIPDGMGAASQGFNPYSALQNQYGTFEAKENPSRVVDVPLKDAQGNRVSEAVQTVMEAKAIPDEVVEMMEDMTVKGDFSFGVKTDKSAMLRADSKVQADGFQKTLDEWIGETKQGIRSKDQTAVGDVLLVNAANAIKTATSAEEKNRIAKDVTDILMNKISRSHDAGQILQAEKMLKKMSPTYQLYALEKQAQQLSRELNEKYSKEIEQGTFKPSNNIPVISWAERTGEMLADKLSKRISDKAKPKTTAKIILNDLSEIANKYVEKADSAPKEKRTALDKLRDMFNNYEFYSKAWEEAKQTVEVKYRDNPDVLSVFNEWFTSALDYTQGLSKAVTNGQYDIQIPSDLAADFLSAETDAERTAVTKKITKYIASQVPSTFIDKWNAWRYLAMLGNPRTHIRNIVGNAGFMPVRMLKNSVAASIETGAQKVGLINERSKSILTLSKADRALMSTAWSDYNNVVDQIQNGGKYDDAKSAIDRERTIFNFKPIESARQANSTALDAEDKWFSQPAYSESLASYLKANKITAEQFNDMKPADKSKAQEYAIKEAQKATYRDHNAFSDFIARLGKNYQGDNKAVKAANVILEGVLPFKRTPANILSRVVEYSPIELAKSITYDVVQVKKGNMSATDMIDHLASGLVGTGLVGLGALLASQGLLSGGGSGDDKQDEFDKMQGNQNYAITIGDQTFTLDWLAPEAVPVFMGVEIFNKISDNSNAGTTFKDILEALGKITDPMLEMSMLQGVQDVIEGVKYSESPLVGAISNAAMGYLTQAVPTLGGQLERSAFEDTRQSTFTDKNSGIPTSVQYLLGKTLNKVPGVEYGQMDYIDAWGRKTSTGGMGERSIMNFLSPAYKSEKNTTEVDTELQRLYDYGATSVLPQRAESTVTINGTKINLSKEDFESYAITKGQTAYSTIQSIISSKAYQSLMDDEKAAVIGRAYAYADYKAKSQEFPQYKGDKWLSTVDKAKSELGMNTADYLQYAEKYGTSTMSGDNIREAYRAGIKPDSYLSYYTKAQKLSSDKDKNGKTIDGSKRGKILVLIDSMNISNKAKDYLYYANGYSAKTINEAPWR